MLGNQLISRAEVPRLVANHALLAGHQHVEVVVDHDRHLDAINRGEHRPILRQHPARANAPQNRNVATIQTATPRSAKRAQNAVPRTLPWNGAHVAHDAEDWAPSQQADVHGYPCPHENRTRPSHRGTPPIRQNDETASRTLLRLSERLN